MAGNVRFHNKFHAYTHYTDPISGIPDSATDPIASKEFPFLGNMYVAGCLSARGWLDEDGTCRKFLYDPDPIACRPVRICGDHMEGALHYSHVDYNNTQIYDPKRLEIDFKQHTFKTIICDENEYHIMPVSLSAGCVTSTRFVNPSSNGGVDLAWHPHLLWLCRRPCYLSAGEEAILSMTSFSNTLSSVVCLWKERETELEKPYVEFSPTITYHKKMIEYTITTCEPIVYNFIIEDTADVVRLNILDTSILLYDDDGDFIWDDTSISQVITAWPDMDTIPSIYEMYQTFPARAGLKTINDIYSVGELLDKSKKIPFQIPTEIEYNNCKFEVEYTDRGSILFTIKVNGATGMDRSPKDKEYLGKITVGNTTSMFYNGVYDHDLYHYDNYIGNNSLKSSVLDKSIWTKEVTPNDPFYIQGRNMYYTIEQHEQGSSKWWIMKSPLGQPIFQNFSKDYSNSRYWPTQNNWQVIDPQSQIDPPMLYTTATTLQKLAGGVYVDGDKEYITDEYILAKYAGVSYGDCFTDWDAYYEAPDNLRVVPEDTSVDDDSEYILAVSIPHESLDLGNPLILLDPTQFTSGTNSPTRYRVGQQIRIYIDQSKTGNFEVDSKYLNNSTGAKSRDNSQFAKGGTFTVVEKRFVPVPTGVTTIGVLLACAQ